MAIDIARLKLNAGHRHSGSGFAVSFLNRFSVDMDTVNFFQFFWAVYNA